MKRIAVWCLKAVFLGFPFRFITDKGSSLNSLVVWVGRDCAGAAFVRNECECQRYMEKGERVVEVKSVIQVNDFLDFGVAEIR